MLNRFSVPAPRVVVYELQGNGDLAEFSLSYMYALGAKNPAARTHIPPHCSRVHTRIPCIPSTNLQCPEVRSQTVLLLYSTTHELRKFCLHVCVVHGTVGVHNVTCTST